MVIRFNRPEKKNAITAAMYHHMTTALAEAMDDEAIRVVAFLGTQGCFTAGNDLADFLVQAQMQASAASPQAPAAAEFIRALAAAEKPLVAGVDGLAIGIGTTLNLHCDLTIASRQAFFKTPFVDLGLVPEAASSLLAPRIMGHQRAFALLVAGEGFCAQAALEAGLIWKIVEPDMVEQETLSAAVGLANKPVQALRIARDLVRGPSAEVLARIDEELRHFMAQLKSAEARAAFERFLQR
jgi:enoyl-CoA hydratase/carnithine racemase